MTQEKIITAAAEEWPPFIDPSIPSEGLALEIVKAAYKTQGYKVKTHYLPWARAEASVKAGKYDILPDTWMTENRKKYLLYSSHYASNNVKFISKKSSQFEYKNLSSLNGMTVGTVRGYGYGDEFLNSKKFKREEVADFMLNIKKLMSGRIDLTLGDEIVARVKIAKYKSSMLNKIVFVDPPLSTNRLYVTSGLKNPNHKKIILLFNKGLKEIKEKGTYERIMEKYGIY